MNYDKALEFVRRSEYVKLATHQKENPINDHDCAMLICEYGEQADRMRIDALDDIRVIAQAILNLSMPEGKLEDMAAEIIDLCDKIRQGSNK